MSANITQGEWTAGVGEYLGKERFVVGLLGTTKLIVVFGDTGADDEEESIANARLVEAAPKMLEALQALVEIIENAGLLNLSNGVQLGQVSWYVKASDRRDAAKAAIAKATGSAA